MYKQGAKSVALVASDGRRCILIDWIGPDFDAWIQASGLQIGAIIDELRAPIGISVWTGRLASGLRTKVLEGSFRPLTDDEWMAYRDEGVIWDEADFYTDEYMQARALMPIGLSRIEQEELAELLGRSKVNLN